MTKEEMKVELENAWKEVLCKDTVVDDSDFFEDGGDSVTAIRLSSELSKKSIKLDITDVFEKATLGEIAEVLAEE